MSDLKFKTNGDASPKGKSRVYFTCTQEDFSTSFEKICNDLFKTCDCAVYYTEDMNARMSERDKDILLKGMNLFVIPVTFRLLSTANRTMDEDFVYAKKEKIPVLPIMLEPKLDHLYARRDRFGTLQYLNPFSTDQTEIAYTEKLAKYLKYVLTGDEMASRARGAFDSRVFLSYRKKDRYYANELMRLIHREEACRNIAIWYDEYLTPGESFSENINDNLKNSNLFMLLVTPSILEFVDGQANFVLREEYPMAKQNEKSVLPVEMVETNKDELCKCFDGISDCISFRDKDFGERLARELGNLTASGRKTEPEHNFLLGFAYLYGIDVEVNKEIALELISAAANAKHPQAMAKMIEIYQMGMGVQANLSTALKWAKKYASYCKAKLGETDEETFVALRKLSDIYTEAGKYKKSLRLERAMLNKKKSLFGEEHIETLEALNRLGSAYNRLAGYGKAIPLLRKVFQLSCKLLGEEHLDTAENLFEMAYACQREEDYETAAMCAIKAYAIRSDILGSKHIDTLKAQSLMAMTAYKAERYDFTIDDALETERMILKSCVEAYDVTHPMALELLGNIASLHTEKKEYEKAFRYRKTLHKTNCAFLGENHPKTIESLIDYADTSMNFLFKTEMNRILKNDKEIELSELEKLLNEFEKVRALIKKATIAIGKAYGRRTDIVVFQAVLIKTELFYRILQIVVSLVGGYIGIAESAHRRKSKRLKQGDIRLLQADSDLAQNYGISGRYEEKRKIEEVLYQRRCERLGKDHLDTLKTLDNLLYSYWKLGETEKYRELEEMQSHADYISLYRREPGLIQTTEEQVTYWDAYCKESVDYFENLYQTRCQTLGKEHPLTLNALATCAKIYERMENYAKAAEICPEIFRLSLTLLGEEHPDTAEAHFHLVICNSKNGIIPDMEAQRELINRLKRLKKKNCNKKVYRVLKIAAFMFSALYQWEKRRIKRSQKRMKK